MDNSIRPHGNADLTTGNWITWTTGQICHDWLRDGLWGNGSVPTITHTASEHSTQLALVAEGLGVAIIPRLGREPVPAGVRIVPVQPKLSRRVHVLWRASAARRPAVNALVHELKRHGETVSRVATRVTCSSRGTVL